jgi:hypothetical protein
LANFTDFIERLRAGGTLDLSQPFETPIRTPIDIDLQRAFATPFARAAASAVTSRPSARASQDAQYEASRLSGATTGMPVLDPALVEAALLDPSVLDAPFEVAAPASRPSQRADDEKLAAAQAAVSPASSAQQSLETSCDARLELPKVSPMPFTMGPPKPPPPPAIARPSKARVMHQTIAMTAVSEPALSFVKQPAKPAQPKVAGLPFASAPSADRKPERRKQRGAGFTMPFAAVTTNPLGKRVVDTAASGGAATKLTLDQFAQLTVRIGLDPERRGVLEAAYGLDNDSHAREKEAWADAMEHQPQLAGRYARFIAAERKRLLRE